MNQWFNCLLTLKTGALQLWIIGEGGKLSWIIPSVIQRGDSLRTASEEWITSSRAKPYEQDVNE